MIGDFLKPPTDNLYKFMTISGLIILLISISYPPWQLNKITLSYYENQRDYQILEAERQHLLQQQRALANQLSTLQDQKDALDRDKLEVEKARAARGSERAAILIEIDRFKEAQSKKAEDKTRAIQEASAAG